MFKQFDVWPETSQTNDLDQTDGSTCGYFAVANLTSIVLKLDPRLQRYNQTKLKGSLLNFAERGQLEIFPRKSGRASTVQNPIAVEV